MALTTEIGLVKTEIASSLAASLYTAKDLVYVAKAIESLANAETTTGVFETVDVNSLLYVGPNADTFNTAAGLTNPVIVAQISNNDYAQIAFKNTSSGANASTDFIAYSNNGTDSDGYIDMGITSQNFSDPDFTITGAGDGYIFMVGAAGGADKGNLVLATSDTGSQNKIIFAAGGLASDDTQMVITPNQNVHIEIPTASTSPTTGALTIVGGVGISGDINIAGNVTFGGAGTTLETSTLAVADPLIFVGNDNITDAVDLGLVAEYATTVSTITKAVSNKALTSNVATLTTSTTHGFAVNDIVVVSTIDATFNGTHVITSVPTTTTFTYVKTATNVASTAIAGATGSAVVSLKRKFAGAVRDASDGVFKVFKDATTKPSGTVNFSEAGLVYGDLQVGPLTASSATFTSAVIGNVDNTEIQYLNGVTSAIQTQLDAKAPLASPTFTGLATFSGGVTINGTTEVNELRESVGNITLASNVGTFDWTTSNLFYIATAPSAAMTFSFTNVPTDNNYMMTTNVFVTQGSTGYIPTTLNINGSAATIRWANGLTPTATNGAGKIDIFTFSFHRTNAGAFIVLGSANQNF
jgi:hypothetical protein